MKTPASQNEWVAVLPVAFRARKVCETFEKRAPRAEEGKVIATNTTNAIYTTFILGTALVNFGTRANNMIFAV